MGEDGQGAGGPGGRRDSRPDTLGRWKARRCRGDDVLVCFAGARFAGQHAFGLSSASVNAGPGSAPRHAHTVGPLALGPGPVRQIAARAGHVATVPFEVHAAPVIQGRAGAETALAFGVKEISGRFAPPGEERSSGVMVVGIVTGAVMAITQSPRTSVCPTRLSGKKETSGNESRVPAKTGEALSAPLRSLIGWRCTSTHGATWPGGHCRTGQAERQGADCVAHAGGRAGPALTEALINSNACCRKRAPRKHTKHHPRDIDVPSPCPRCRARVAPAVRAAGPWPSLPMSVIPFTLGFSLVLVGIFSRVFLREQTRSRRAARSATRCCRWPRRNPVWWSLDGTTAAEPRPQPSPTRMEK